MYIVNGFEVLGFEFLGVFLSFPFLSFLLVRFFTPPYSCCFLVIMEAATLFRIFVVIMCIGIKCRVIAVNRVQVSSFSCNST